MCYECEIKDRIEALKDAESAYLNWYGIWRDSKAGNSKEMFEAFKSQYYRLEKAAIKDGIIEGAEE